MINPTAQSVKEDQLLNELGTIGGRGSFRIPAPTRSSSRQGATGVISMK
jgi:hypothetical protein